jgi:hypothetical protein
VENRERNNGMILCDSMGATNRYSGKLESTCDFVFFEYFCSFGRDFKFHLQGSELS